MNTIRAAAVRRRARAGPDHPNTPIKLGLLCLKEAERPLSILFQKNNKIKTSCVSVFLLTFRPLNTLRTGDADLRFYITTVQDG